MGLSILFGQKILIQQQTVFVDPILPYIMDEFYSYDIDTQEDFHLTERQLRFFLMNLKMNLLKVEVYGKYTSRRY